MTDIPDGRVAAFVCAWNALQSAGDIRNQVTKKDGHAPLPDVYWAAVAEAAVFADLARVDMPTGVTACAVINQVETAKQAAIDTIANIFGTRTRQNGPTTTDHAFLPVDGHPDDNECTHRADGTDATYCGEPRDRHTS